MIVYLGHPVGETNGDDAIRRADNIANAMRWVSFLAETTTWSIVAPWHIYVIALKNGAGHRRIVHSLQILERCDMLLLCGGHISGHMRDEISRAKRTGIPILDLTLGDIHPPDDKDEDAVQAIMSKARRTLLRQPRRVWVPRLTDADVLAMKDARHALYTHMPDEHPAAVAILDRLIAAAIEDPTA